jgi:hypothetical protein
VDAGHCRDKSEFVNLGTRATATVRAADILAIIGGEEET